MYNGDTMQRTQIYLPKTQTEELKRIAQRKRISTSEVIRAILKEKIEELSFAKKISGENLLAAAKRINQQGQKAPKDLATNLDKYLYA